MLGQTYERQNCSAARALEIVGERWSLLIIRDALFKGTTRFADFRRSLGVATNILSARLDRFVEAGLMERQHAGESSHQEYVLTEKGRDLGPVLIDLMKWGDRWAAPNGPPLLFEHADCGGDLQHQLVCTRCAEIPAPGDVITRPGPGDRRPEPAFP